MTEALTFAAGGVTGLVIAWFVKPLVAGFIAGLRGEHIDRQIPAAE